MSDIKKGIPTDARGNPFHRAQDIPLCEDSIYLGSTTWVDMVSFDSYPERAFDGIHVENPSTIRDVEIAIGPAGTTSKCLKVRPGQNFCLDNQFFGTITGSTRLRARLDAASGVLASGTFNYNNGGTPVVQPSNGDVVTVNGTDYEFSTDQSVVPGRVKVDVGATADDSWTNFVAAVIASDQAVTASINTGTNVVTITSNYGGTTGNSIAISTSISGVVVSGATLSGGSGGVVPTIHLW